MVVFPRPPRGATRQQPGGAVFALSRDQTQGLWRSRLMDRFAQTVDLLSVIQTCRAQARSVMEFFKQVLMAQVSAAVPKPSLIPR